MEISRRWAAVDNVPVKDSRLAKVRFSDSRLELRVWDASEFGAKTAYCVSEFLHRLVQVRAAVAACSGSPEWTPGFARFWLRLATVSREWQRIDGVQDRQLLVPRAAPVRSQSLESSCSP